MTNMIFVRPVPGRLVQDIDALNAGLRRFVGCDFDRATNTWKPKSLPVVIDASRAEYKRALKAGDLTIVA